jgi:hypothetical protein
MPFRDLTPPKEVNLEGKNKKNKTLFKRFSGILTTLLRRIYEHFASKFS